MPGSWRYVKAPRRSEPGVPGLWSDKKKNEAIAVFLATGSATMTSEQTNVPIHTINKWKVSPWWKEKVLELQKDDYDRLDTKLGKAIDKALDEVMDRLDKGEYMFDVRTGKVKRIPAKLRDINTSFTQLLDKRQLIRKQPTKIVEQQSSATQLQNLAEQFTKFVTGKLNEDRVVDLVKDCIEGDNVVQLEDGSWGIKDD
jgi:DNA polymerase III alpha subunit (gram-positive type)